MNSVRLCSIRGIGAMLLLGVFSGGAFAAAPKVDDLPGPLVSATWLHDHAQSVQIVDLRDDLDSLSNEPKYYTENGKKVLDQIGGHIPDALSVNFWALREKRKIDGKTLDFQFPTAEEFQTVMQTSQLENNKSIVIVPTGDQGISLQEAAFLALELQVYGVPADQVAILNGGTHAWIAAGYPVVVDAVVPMTSSHWAVKSTHTDLIVHTAQVRAAQKAGELLLDARPLAEFIGVSRSPVIAELGRIPGAEAMPAEALYYRAEDGSWRFMQADRYKAVLAALRLDTAKPSIVYCNTGQYAAGAWFILHRIMGLNRVREYTGSIYAWEHHGLPVVGL
ncbi:MAG: sulfurtransferase [Halothiobacillus sp.]